MNFIVQHIPYGPYEKFIKRPLDCVLSGFAILALSPAMITIALLVKKQFGSPVIYKQERIGLNERLFYIYKFRSMTNEKDQNGVLLPDSERLTGFGKKLRSSSLDELPELFNILKGDMAIIGPRPLLPSYLPFFREEERARHEVRGGLTVPEVLLKKTHTSWDEQLKVEAYYAHHITLKTDVKILFATIGVLFKRVDSRFGGDIREPLSEVRKDWNQ